MKVFLMMLLVFSVLFVWVGGCSPAVVRKEVGLEDGGAGPGDSGSGRELWLSDGASGSEKLGVDGGDPARRLPMQGITMTCPRSGQIWSTPSMEENVKEARQLGANWFSYHPYIRIQNDGECTKGYDDEWVKNPLVVAKKQGMKVMMIPHISYFRSVFSWRGEIVFSDEVSWARFFSTYQTWIVALASLAEAGKADIFSVGIEYKKTLSREKEWRALIAAVRKVYSGKLIYAANWDSYQNVPFWDALDYVGIQAYFPVTDTPDPSESVLLGGWRRILTEVSNFSKKKGRPVIFTELGYNRSSKAAAEPWSYEEGGPNADEIKLRCMKVALEQTHRPSFLEGVFLWKWFPDSRISSRDFILQYPEMKKVIEDAWSGP